MTDICSRYFWKTIPERFHNFDTIVARNNNEEEMGSEFDPDTESEDEDDADRPLTEQQFESSTYWFTFRQMEHQAKACAICLLYSNNSS